MTRRAPARVLATATACCVAPCLNRTSSWVGACAGDETCANGQYGACDGDPAGTEICDGQVVDEDCDGNVDEGCVCQLNDTQDCGTDVGLCLFGTETCNINGQWDHCQGGQVPAQEICNNLNEDENCDGAVDGICHCQEDQQRDCGVGACAGQETCLISGVWSFCFGGAISNRPPL